MQKLSSPAHQQQQSLELGLAVGWASSETGGFGTGSCLQQETWVLGISQRLALEMAEKKPEQTGLFKGL